jgi:phosphate transport system substrate-binding protein
MKKVLIFLLVISMVLVGFVGCGEKKEEVANKEANNKVVESKGGEEKTKETNVSTKKELSGTISIVGSTSVAPLAEKLAEEFKSLNPKVKVEIQAVGSTAGVKAAKDKTGQIGMASRNLKTEEEEWNLTKHIIAYDGIAVVVNPSNDISELSKEQVKKIFKGEITNWNEIGGKDEAILVVSRESGSGTRGAFEDIVSLKEKVEINGEMKKVSQVREDALIADGNGVVMANVASKNNAVGYVSLSYVDDTVKSLKIDGEDATVENIQKDKYKISRPFLMLTNGEMDDVTKEYIDFVFSDKGQEIVSLKNISVK